MIENIEHQHAAFIAARPWVKARFMVEMSDHQESTDPLYWNILYSLIANPDESTEDDIGNILLVPLLGKEHLDSVLSLVDSTSSDDAWLKSKMWKYLPINPFFHKLPPEEQARILERIPYDDDDEEEEEDEEEVVLFHHRRFITHMASSVTRAAIQGNAHALYLRHLTDLHMGLQAEGFVSLFIQAFSENPWISVETLETCLEYEQRTNLPQQLLLNWDLIAANNMTAGISDLLEKYQSRLTKNGFLGFCSSPNSITYDYEQITRTKAKINAQIVERPELVARWLKRCPDPDDLYFGFYPGCVCDAESGATTADNEVPDAKKRRIA